MASLREFADDSNSDHTLLWWQLAGAGGVGKSRLALQFAQMLDKEGWHAGFLNKKQLEETNWCKEYLPSRTFIIVDYVAEESKASNFADMIRSLSMRKDLSKLKAVRVLALEREPYQLSVDASKGSVALKNWLTPALNHDQKGHALRTHAFRERKDSKDSGSEPSEALELGELTEKAMADIVASWRLHRGKSPLDENDKKHLLDCLRRLNGNQAGASGRSEAWRPLFAMLMAEAFDCDRHEFSAMTIEGLLDNFLESEQASWSGKPDSLTESQRLGRTFAMISTVCGGLDWKKLFEAIEPDKAIKQALKVKECEVSEVDKWAWRYVGRNVISTIPLEHPPLESRTPDLLGEYFVLKTIAKQTTNKLIVGPDEAAVVINAAVRLDCNGMVEFMLRAQQDFSSHEGLKRLRGALNDPSVPLQMFHAAELGFLNLLNKRLSKSTKAEDRDCALLLAADGGHADCVRALLDKGADLNAAHSGSKLFPLLVAALNGHADCVRTLLGKGADPNAVHSKNGFSPLLVAAHNGHANCVKALLAKGADPNAACSNGAFPLLVAAQNGYADCVKALLNKGADPDAAHSGDGPFPLLAATHNGHADCVKALLDKGADPDATHSKNELFPLLAAAHNGHADCVRTLLAKGADPNAARSTGAFPLLAAAHNGHAGCVKALLDAKANPSAVHRKIMRSPLQLAIQKGHTKVVALLLRAAMRRIVVCVRRYIPLT